MKNIIIYLAVSLLLFQSCRSDFDDVLNYDIVIYGGTSAGVIAAYSAHLLGKEVLLIEPGKRIGGLSSGGLGQTDIGNKYAVTGLSRNFYRRIGNYYNKFESWTFEPKIALNVFNDFIEEGGIKILYSTRLINVNKNNGWIESIETENPLTNARMQIKGKMFIDCSYEGDLMANSGVDYVVGREPNSQYNERFNGVQILDKHQFPDGIDPFKIKGDSTSGLLWGIRGFGMEEIGTGDRKVQAYNFRICLTDSTENMIPITKPENYNPEKYELLIRLMEKDADPKLWNYFSWGRMPKRKTDINNNGAFSTDMIGENWDYPEANYERRADIFNEHLDYTKGLLYFVKTDNRVPKVIKEELNKWGYPKDEYVDNNNFTPQLYIREARRMVGEYVMTEHNCLGEITVDDGIGLAAYTMDSHNCDRIVINGMVKNEGDVQIGGFGPYPISYRSITPKREEVKNLLVPVGLSASHIAYGSIRMEPVFMVLGQSASIAASMAIDEGISVQNINVDKLQQKLKDDPYLDGSIPDILVDNDLHPERIKINGNWQETIADWGTKANGTKILLNRHPKKYDSVQFYPDIKHDSKYSIYVYTPVLYGILREGDFYSADKGIFQIDDGNMISEIIFEYSSRFSDWVKMGTFEISKNNQIKISVLPTGDGAASVDAILLVAEN